jgi:hypothetical protein
MVFGKGGLVETLGPTWNLIHDPRFALIESAFIVDRRAIFGGDAKQGKQYISSEGTFTSTIADLEQYSEILGEGRHFHNVLSHNKDCLVRKWLERTHTNTTVKASPELVCECPDSVRSGIPYVDPRELKDKSDEFLWALIHKECPNYFDKMDKPNLLARRLFDLFRADLIGLIHDYAVTPLIDDWIMLETGDVVEENEYTRQSENPRVFAEVDILEKALTYRATLRATAAKVLRSIGFQNYLRKFDEGKPLKLTDIERDHLLRLVYQSKWPDGKEELLTELTSYVESIAKTPFDERLEQQLGAGREQSRDTIAKLVSGELKPINQYTEPNLEVTMDEEARVVEAIMSNPLKMELFLVFAQAEKDSNTKVVEILAPVFASADYELTDEGYYNILEAVKATGFYQSTIVGYTEEFHSDASGRRGWEQPVDLVELNKPKRDREGHDEGCAIGDCRESHYSPKGSRFPKGDWDCMHERDSHCQACREDITRNPDPRLRNGHIAGCDVGDLYQAHKGKDWDCRCGSQRNPECPACLAIIDEDDADD